MENGSSSTENREDPFYQSCLHEELENLKVCSDDVCTKKKSSLRKEQTELQAKMKKCEQALSSCLSCIDEKKKKTEKFKEKYQRSKDKMQPATRHDQRIRQIFGTIQRICTERSTINKHEKLQ